MSRLTVALALGSALVAASAAGAPAPSATTPTIDRTLRCTPGLSGGVREIEVRGHSGIRQGSFWKQLPFAVVSSGQVGTRPGALDDSLAYVAAGRAHEGLTTVDTDFRATHALDAGSLAFNRTVCKPVAARIPLTARGLEGGAVGPFGDEYDCTVPRVVLVRVRATLKSPGALFSDQGLTKTRTAVSTGYLAVRTVSGKPVVFASVSEPGKTQLFTAPTCVAD